MPEVRYTLASLGHDLSRLGESYLEFLRIPSMSAGLYVLPADGKDEQTPHREDEIYYVLKGKAIFQRSGQDLAVTAGDVLFVPARSPHHFHHIVERLELLVVFAPAETGPA